MIFKKDNPLELCELKFDDAEEGSIQGYASKFNGNDAVDDTIEPGAFTKSLETRERPPHMLFGHNPGRVIGKWADLKEDDSGLIAKGLFTPGNRDAQDARASAKFGAIDGLSIGFRIPPGGAEKKDNGGRIIKEIDLVEISLVTFPADSDARISVVKQDFIEMNTIKEWEGFLRELGLSRSMATAAASQFKRVIQSESEDTKDRQIAALLEQVKEYDRLLRVQNSTDVLVQAILRNK
jgi:HK97 family phage prohead protease